MGLFSFLDVRKVGCCHFLSTIPVHDMFSSAAMGIISQHLNKGQLHFVCLIL